MKTTTFIIISMILLLTLKTNANAQNQSSTDKKTDGALYWFNWQKISDTGKKFYGAYIYRHILQYLSPNSLGNEKITCVIMDGDFLSSTRLDLRISITDPTMIEVNKQGINTMYIIAIKGDDNFDYKKLDSELKRIATGYVGMVKTPQMNTKEFLNMGQSMALIPAIRIEGNYLKKIDFELLNNQALEKMDYILTR